MYWGIAHGRMRSARKTPLPKSGRLRSIAIDIPSTRWKKRFTAVQMTVFPKK
jgi:hypothetical protein